MTAIQAQTFPLPAPVGVIAPGMRVRVRDEEWLTTEVHAVGGGHVAVKAQGLTELVRGHASIFLSTFDRIEPVRTEETDFYVDTSPAYRTSRLFLESLLRRSTPTDERLYIGHQAALQPANYQLRPAQDALKALLPRVLIADGVGLGKTLEVGILLSELVVRGKGDRILVVVMKAMLEQFQRELWTRFSLPLERLDSVGIKRARERLPTGKNPFQHFKRAIISIDTLKNERQYKKWLEDSQWDAVVIDECHNAVNEGTGRQKVANLLARTSEAFILASATPHNGRPESFAQLMQMLDQTAIADPSQYTADDIRGLYRRRFKKDIEHEVSAHFPKRDPKLCWSDATPAEDAIYDAIAASTFHTLNRKSRVPGQQQRDVLFRTVLMKSWLSSPWAFKQTVKSRRDAIEKRLGQQHPQLLRSHLENDRDTLGHLLGLVERPELGAPAKLSSLFDDVLPELGITAATAKKPDMPRVVIFSERLETLKALADAFADRLGLYQSETNEITKGRVAVLTGQESDTTTQALLQTFAAADGEVRVLLCSDMASEGVNLHHACSRLVHFDIPWSLIRLEQRTGRVDRYGQREVPRIRYLLTRTNTAAKADVHLVEKLIEKERAAKENLGDEGALMGLYDPDLEEEAVAAGLSAGETEDVIFAKHSHGGSDGGGSAGGLSFLDELLGIGHAQPAGATEPPPPVATMPTVYESDLAFFREALTELEPIFAGASEPLKVDENPARALISFRVPDELRRRLESLPVEARLSEGEHLTLSADREQIMLAIDAARKADGQWPALQFLWRLHPVLTWATERVLIRLGKNEAPVIVARELCGEQEAVALFHGTLANKLGRPTIVSWFGIRGRVDNVGVDPTAMSLSDILSKTRLSSASVNPGVPKTSLDALRALRSPFVAAAKAHMITLRQQRAAESGEVLRDHLRRAADWERAAQARLQRDKASLMEKPEVGRLHRRRLQHIDDALADVARSKKQRTDWVNKRFSTDTTPHLRLAAVFVAR